MAKNKPSTEPNWFAVNRSLIESDLWQSEPFTKSQAWIDLIGLARFSDGFGYKRGIEIPLKRGQLCWSEVKLSARWSWSRGKTKRFLNDLETKQQIVQQNTNVTTVTSIVNYERYQPYSTANGTANGTADGQVTVQQADTKEECYKEKTDNNGKKNKHSSEPQEATKPEDAVLTFPTNGEVKEWHLRQSKLDEWAETYEGIDALSICKVARQWILDNPTKKKTARGMSKFLGAWIGREINSGRGSQVKSLFRKTEEKIDVVV